MATKYLAIAIFFFVLCSTPDSSKAFSFIFINDPGPPVNLSDASNAKTDSSLRGLVLNLERITGLQLEVRNGYLKLRSSPTVLLLPQLFQLPYSPHYSPTARELLISATKTSSVYRVQGTTSAELGRVMKGNLIELDFIDMKYLVFRGVPREAFDPGMIFLHELVHKHLGLMDPTLREIKENRNAKGATVQFMNQIEKELGLPERVHYFPKRSRNEASNRYFIYFGHGPERIEIDGKLFNGSENNREGYFGLLRKN